MQRALNQKLHSGLFLELRFLEVQYQLHYFAVVAPAETASADAVVVAVVVAVAAAIVAADVAVAPRSKRFHVGCHFSLMYTFR